MGLFNDILKGNESLFTDEIALDFDYLPKIIPYRENEQKYIAACIKPLFQNRNGKNLVITGKPGIGKTAAIRHIFEELEQETDSIIPIYINCWKKDTPHKIALEICEKLDYKFTQNKTTEDLIREITRILNKKSAVFCFDEVDKLEDTSVLYTIIEDIYKKTIILITNYKSWTSKLDQRIKSRLMPEMTEFKPYNYDETRGILNQRIEYAFVPGVFDKEAVELIAEKTAELEDIRTGLFLLKESGLIAESEAKKKITMEESRKAIEKIKDFKNEPDSLPKEEKEILGLIKQNLGKSAKSLYDLYFKKDEISYRTFLRKLDSLEKSNLITKKDIYEGGRSTQIELK